VHQKRQISSQVHTLAIWNGRQFVASWRRAKISTKKNSIHYVSSVNCSIRNL